MRNLYTHIYNSSEIPIQRYEKEIDTLEKDLNVCLFPGCIPLALAVRIYWPPKRLTEEMNEIQAVFESDLSAFVPMFQRDNAVLFTVLSNATTLKALLTMTLMS